MSIVAACCCEPFEIQWSPQPQARVPQVIWAMDKGASSLRSVCVFCGASDGRNSLYTKAASELGGELARLKIGLVYGGAASRTNV